MISRVPSALVAALLFTSVVACDKLKGQPADSGAPDVAVAVVPDAAVPDVGDAAVEAATDVDATAPLATASAPVHTFKGPVGTFQGAVKEGGNPPYSMTAVLTPTGGTVSYAAPFSCRGTWTLTSHDSKSFTYREKIAEQNGTKKCVDGNTVHLDEVKAGTTYNYSDGSAHAVIAKTK
jgi:hypothetical protein